NLEKSMGTGTLISVLGIIGIITLALIAGCTSDEAPSQKIPVAPAQNPQTAIPTTVQNDVVAIPLSQITSTVQKKTYDAQGAQVRFMVVKGSDGEVRTAFDACDVCGGALGYRQIGSDVMCTKCGKYFAIDGLGTENTQGGGCWPSYLPHIISGDNILVKKSDLEAGRFRFV
ncbi:hypothetical protein COY95_00730, partial [Candidatus Woesearchaeota archaeon CG_4_10_14_0_8_um_filter_47_5]